MAARLQIPYGIADFKRIRDEGYYYVDKTAYIRKMEARDSFVFFVRPRRMGKSLFVDTLRCYYDVNEKANFARLFGDLDIGRSPTENANRYLVLTLDFSQVEFMGGETLEEKFSRYLASRMAGFVEKYRAFLPGLPAALPTRGGADMFEAVDRARRKLGGETLFVANMDPELGLPRIRNYCREIYADLDSKGVSIDVVTGGLDEYSILGERMKEAVDSFKPDLLVLMGICHAYPEMGVDDILITDQPRQLANYLNLGYRWAVGEISSHSMVMGAHSIVPLETAETLRELLR